MQKCKNKLRRRVLCGFIYLFKPWRYHCHTPYCCLQTQYWQLQCKTEVNWSFGVNIIFIYNMWDMYLFVTKCVNHLIRCPHFSMFDLSGMFGLFPFEKKKNKKLTVFIWWMLACYICHIWGNNQDLTEGKGMHNPSNIIMDVKIQPEGGNTLNQK